MRVAACIRTAKRRAIETPDLRSELIQSACITLVERDLANLFANTPGFDRDAFKSACIPKVTKAPRKPQGSLHVMPAQKPGRAC